MKVGISSLFLFLSMVASFATPLTESTFTSVVKDVEVVDASSHNSQPAKVKDLFKAPNLVRTGPSSRAELTAPDNSITRVGANTVFSFSDSGREINLEQGSVLFHSPHGKGGGVIKSGGASAAVTGTTLIVAAVPSNVKGQEGGFKVVLLEGSGEVRLKSGKKRSLKAGELIFILPGHNDFGQQVMINLSKLVAGSTLVHGYTAALPSMPLVQTAMLDQQKKITSGTFYDTHQHAANFFQSPTSEGGSGGTGGSGGNGGTDPNNIQHSTYNVSLQSVVSGGLNNGGGGTITPNFRVPGIVATLLTDSSGNPVYDAAGNQITVYSLGPPSASFLNQLANSGPGGFSPSIKTPEKGSVSKAINLSVASTFIRK